MKCTIILHYKMVEERCFAWCDDGEKTPDGVIVRVCRLAMGNGFVQRHRVMIVAVYETVGDRCELKAFKENQGEHELRNVFLVIPLSNIHGNVLGMNLYNAMSIKNAELWRASGDVFQAQRIDNL